MTNNCNIGKGQKDPFRYSEVCTRSGLYTNATTPNEVAQYFNKFGETYMLETQIIPGRTLIARLRTHADYESKFLPPKDIDSIPFSSDKLPEILNRFSIQPRSKESAAIEETIRTCEENQRGEHKLCATSLESMVSFVKSKLGENVSPISFPYINKDGKIKYRMTGVKKLVDYGSHTVVCHKEQYPYAVFTCHQVEMTSAYVASMVGDGIHMEATVACHKDTSWWSPKHVSFQVLKAKPGTPICHFLDDLSIIWTKK